MQPVTNNFMVYTPKVVSIDVEVNCDGDEKKMKLIVLASKVDVESKASWELAVSAQGEAIKDELFQKIFVASTSHRFLLNIGVFDPLYLPEDGVTLNLAEVLDQSMPLGKMKEKEICHIETDIHGGLVFDINSQLKRDIKELA